MQTIEKQEMKKNGRFPAILLRVEGVVVLAAAVALYAQQGFSWLLFALLLFTPDLAFVAYGVNKRVGAAAYNLVHTYTLPIALALLALLLNSDVLLQAALILFAHIGLDRTVGYGLKYADDFHHTHLQQV